MDGIAEVWQMRDVTLDGLWWLPHDPDRRIAGTVALSGEDRPTLRLIGTFTHEQQEPGGAFHVTVPERHRMIHGRCEGKAVTLIDCQSMGYRGGLRRPSDVSIHGSRRIGPGSPNRSAVSLSCG